MKQIRKIAVNNGNYRVIYKDEQGVYHIVLEDAAGNRDKDDFWHYQLKDYELQKLYDDYYNRKIPEDFWSGYEIIEDPLKKASDGDVIMLVNWYKYKQKLEVDDIIKAIKVPEINIENIRKEVLQSPEIKGLNDEISQLRAIEAALTNKNTNEYTLSNGDIQQLINRYENAKAIYKMQREDGNPEWQFECGRAYALEGVLRMLGFFYDEVIKEQGICR